MRVKTLLSLAFFLVFWVSCLHFRRGGPKPESTLSSEVDSFTPRTIAIDWDKSRQALIKIDKVTDVYLEEALAWARRESPCDGRCMAFIVSETLAASGRASSAEAKLKRIKRGDSYKSWGVQPEFPGSRGYFGAIEPLISKGRTTDGRFTLEEGVLRIPLEQSFFNGIHYKDSPGSFLEVGSLLPYEMPKGAFHNKGGEKLFIGSDKFGHFLSTGYEYLEAYLETYDETLKASLKVGEAEKRAHFATLVRGLLTEVTLLGGWTSRVFSYADLAANYAGFMFFKDIATGKSEYFQFDPVQNTWRLGPKKFSWQNFIEPGWDEGVNCSHFYPSLLGDNELQQKVMAHYVAYFKKTGKDLSCPALPESCTDIVQFYHNSFGSDVAETLISPTCRELAGGLPRMKPSEMDLGKDQGYYDRIGMYSGSTVKEMAKVWCQKQRESLVRERCESARESYGDLETCVKKIKRVTAEKFRCELDARDFAGWML